MAARTLREKLRYRSDEFLSGGAGRQLFFLFALTMGLVLVFAVASGAGRSVGVAVGDGDTFLDRAWFYFGRLVDSGTMTGDTGNVNRLVSTLATMLGVVVAGLLISSLAGNFQERLEAIRRGGSPVVEHGHFLVLGWSEKVFSVVDQLAEANAGESGLVFVVMAERGKVEMEDALRAKVKHAGRVKLVVRTGSSVVQADLSRVAFDDARAIVVLVDDDAVGDAHRADGRVIKTLMALYNHPDARDGIDRIRVTAEVMLPDSKGVASIASRGRAQVVNTNDVISKIILQTARITGLSLLYEELLRFEGNELHVVDVPAARGRPFGDLLLAFPSACVVGVAKRDGSGHLLNPPADHVVGEDEAVLVVAEDERVEYVPPAQSSGVASANAARAPVGKPLEHLLVLGWNEKIFPILRELDAYVAAGSSVTLVNTLAAEDRALLLARHVGALEHVQAHHVVGEFSSRKVLAELHPERFETVIVLGDTANTEGGVDAEGADTRAIVALLLLRDFREQAGLGSQEVCSEILDPRNRALAASTEIYDIVISNEMVAMVLAQVTQDPRLSSVLEDLFSSDGAEVYLKDLALYVAPGETTSFDDLLVVAKARGEVAFGLQIGSRDTADRYGIRVNPSKDRRARFAPKPGDRLIVLAEDDG